MWSCARGLGLGRMGKRLWRTGKVSFGGEGRREGGRAFLVVCVYIYKRTQRVNPARRKGKRRKRKMHSDPQLEKERK